MPDVAAIWAAAAAPPIVPQRAWLDALALAVPGAMATRCLLLADLACLVGIALSWRRRWLALPVVIVLGFTALNTLGLLLNDFYLALAAFHVAVAVTTLAVLRRAAWLGAAALMLAIGLGIAT